MTDRPVASDESRVVSEIVRAGDRYVSRPWLSGSERAETVFRVVRREAGRTWLEAEPLTGRTHQIRAHAAAEGFPILGDTLYGGTPALRMWLHAETLKFRHPGSEAPVSFHAPADFEMPAAAALRAACVAADETDAFRLVHGAADGVAGWYVDQLDGWLLSQSEPAAATLPTAVDVIRGDRPHYHKVLRRQTRETGVVEASPRLVRGVAAPEHFVVRENGVRYELSFGEGGSVGLFLDQRDNRRRLLVNHVAARFPLIPADPAGREVLNCFAYTCGFSVCAALAGARATSLDLSRKYLEWGRRNFALNGLDPAAHDFIHGDVFDWLRRLAKKRRQFDAVLLDPPTFSRSKERGDFSAESDFGGLVTAALPVLRPGGVLFASTNAARLTPARFLADVQSAISAARRKIVQEQYVPQPPDFPVTRDEPAHLKTVWLRVE